MKRLISIITAAVMTCTGLIGAMPANAQEITNAKTASLDSDISVEGTNSFGNLLSSELDSEVAEQEENNGYNVFSAEVTGTEVAVSFETMSDCTLLAAIYDEAGETLIASGTAQVTEEETEKTVTIETDEMPQYFYMMVYLVDETTMRPMCTAYESPNYTQEMQEFFALTVNDFDSERVLNLDEDETNNFAIYSEDTIIIESDETVNTVTTADIDNENYVIENSDSTVTSLQAGDIFVIEQTSGEVLIVKVGEITVDGTTATITGVDAEMEEVFEIVKIDTTQTNEEATIDTSNMSEGVTYEGETNEIQALTAQTKNGSGGDSTTTSLKFSFKFLEGKSDDGSTSVSLSGSVSLSSKVSLKYSISWSRKYVELTFVDKFNFSISISGTMTKEIKLGEAGFSICPGVYVSVVPKIVFEFSMTASFDFTLESTSGFSLEHTKKKGFKQKNLAKKPKMNASINIEGTFAVGVALEANLSVVSEKIFRAGFEASAKLELSLGKSKELYNSEEHPDSKHTCKVCLEGDLSVKTEISFNAKFLNSKKLSFKFVLASKKAKLKDVYFSIDNMKGGFTTCPYYAYRTDFEITDSDGNAIEGLTLEIRDMSTNEWLDGIEGTRNIYLLGGRHYHVRTYYNGLKYDEIFEVKKAAKHVALILDEDNASAPVTTTAPTTTTETTTTTNETTTTTTDSSVVASGTCGENLTWVLDDEGTLTISGTGDMTDYNADAPWFDYRDSIISVIIEDGITSIGNYAFAFFDALTSIFIPDSVTSIGNCAFYECTRLKQIIIPDGVTYIGDSAFRYCYNVTSVTISASVTYIGDRGFGACEALEVINVNAENSNYTSLDGVLFNKDKTTLIQYPPRKTDEAYTIPDSVTSIGNYAFYPCHVFSSITIPDSVTNIGKGAFFYCDALTDVYYTGTEEQWNEITISSGNDDLTNATIHYNSTGEVSTVSLLTTAKNSAEEATLLTESFTDLLPNEVYNFYVMKSRAAESPFSGENLLYVTQAVSDENGGLTVSYIPKEAFETADIFVAGLTRTDISAATVTVPEITYTGEEILVNPEVTLNGQALTEGIDYDVEGGYLVTRPDEYTITISGTGDYTGSVDVTFTAVCGHDYDGNACTICGAENPDYVEPTEPPTGEDILLGDVDGDGAVNASDASKVLAEYAIIATGGTPTFSEEQTKAADVNADGATDAIDASSILGYYAFVATGGSGTIEEYLN